MSKYYCNPLNLEYRYQLTDSGSGEPSKLYREAADPSMVVFKGRYYLFPSMTAGFFVSNDLIEWKFHEFLSEMPVYDYAPDVCVAGDYLYFSASKKENACSFYRSRNPLVEGFEEIHGTFPFWDPGLFADDDGRFYLYWGCSNTEPIYGVELNAETMKPETAPVSLFYSNKERLGYERAGQDHACLKNREEIEAQAQAMIKQMEQIPEKMRMQLGLKTYDDIHKMAYAVAKNDPFIEGPWMTKYQGKYYLQYSVPGTEYNIYGDGVYISDAPLGPFVPAKNNPYSYKPGGFMNGAGHGSTMEDLQGNFWHISTMGINVNHSMERRLGLWKAGFDAEGELYCDQSYGDWPIRIDAPAFEKPDWMLLSYTAKVTVSSGKGSEYVTDENVRTYWKADTADAGQWLCIDLGITKEVHAVQINFMDDGSAGQVQAGEMEPVGNERRCFVSEKGKTKWLLEGSNDGKSYFILCDKSKAETDLAHDFIVWEEGRKVRYLKLTVKELPYGKLPTVSGIRVFGKDGGQRPKQTAGVALEREGDLDVLVSWEEDDAVGHNIFWGYAPDKLYHSYMVYGKNSQKIGAMISGQETWFRIDAFNETGITEGEIIKL